MSLETIMEVVVFVGVGGGGGWWCVYVALERMRRNFIFHEDR